LGSRLRGKNILLVGAAGNLGPSWAGGMLEEGATVFALGLGVNDCYPLNELAKKFPNNLLMGIWDVTTQASDADISEIFPALAGARELHGLVYNAGIDSPAGAGGPQALSFDHATWDTIFQVNVFGFANIVSAVRPLLAETSSIVAVGSMYGLVSPRLDLYSHYFDGKGSIKHPAYGASKAALLALAKQFGTHLAPRGTRVNTLTLGGVEGNQDSEFQAKFALENPQNRMVPISEALGAMTYLLSEDSLSMTAQNLIVDGGYTAW